MCISQKSFGINRKTFPPFYCMLIIHFISYELTHILRKKYNIDRGNGHCGDQVSDPINGLVLGLTASNRYVELLLPMVARFISSSPFTDDGERSDRAKRFQIRKR